MQQRSRAAALLLAQRPDILPYAEAITDRLASSDYLRYMEWTGSDIKAEIYFASEEEALAAMQRWESDLQFARVRLDSLVAEAGSSSASGAKILTAEFTPADMKGEKR
ncbi:hypothetical protein [Paenibacillus protaetiae]|uniref:hypothetical protein n=1 Tax=Paenibacillus protaetiae TaxID=2509456 RepID=UPI0013EAD489|nr:hypothetical protein [Paenibacillus protaetiae]